MLKVMDAVKNGQKPASTTMAVTADRIVPKPFSMHFKGPE